VVGVEPWSFPDLIAFGDVVFGAAASCSWLPTSFGTVFGALGSATAGSAWAGVSVTTTGGGTGGADAGRSAAVCCVVASEPWRLARKYRRPAPTTITRAAATKCFRVKAFGRGSCGETITSEMTDAFGLIGASSVMDGGGKGITGREARSGGGLGGGKGLTAVVPMAVIPASERRSGGGNGGGKGPNEVVLVDAFPPGERPSGGGNGGGNGAIGSGMAGNEERIVASGRVNGGGGGKGMGNGSRGGGASGMGSRRRGLSTIAVLSILPNAGGTFALGKVFSSGLISGN